MRLEPTSCGAFVAHAFGRRPVGAAQEEPYKPEASCLWFHHYVALPGRGQAMMGGGGCFKRCGRRAAEPPAEREGAVTRDNQ